ncbi:MAG: hypothetical protein HDT25_05160 [Ruminococcus sp.]|nr:hypothetical protein [Ruminococcus sp.]
MTKKHRIITVILISLMALSLILNLMFWIGLVSAEFEELIISNPITLKLLIIYILTSLLWAFISFINAVHAVMGLREIYKSKSTTPKRLTKYWIYLAVSLGSLVLHLMSFREFSSWVV